eukprot:3066214-Pyramimonas_sp.AAC.1
MSMSRRVVFSTHPGRPQSRRCPLQKWRAKRAGIPVGRGDDELMASGLAAGSSTNGTSSNAARLPL